MRKYKGFIIDDKVYTSMGYLYSTYCNGQLLRADTLQGMKKIITETLKN